MARRQERGARASIRVWARTALLSALLAGLVAGCAGGGSAPAGAAKPGGADTAAAKPSAGQGAAPPAAGTGGAGANAATAPAAAAPSTGAAGSGAAGATLPMPGPLATPAKVRVGSVGSLADGPIFVAHERGYFTELGLDVEDIRAQGVTELVAPLAAGQIEVLAAAMAAGLYNAFARNIDVRIVSDKGRLTKGHGNAGLVVRQDLWDSGQVRSLADLRGRRVGLAGYNAGSAVTLFLGNALDARGMSIADIDPVNIVLGDLNAAFANNSLDAAIQIEPVLTVGVANGLYSIMMRSDELYPDLQSGFNLYSADFIRNQNDAGRRWMIAYLRGARDWTEAFDKKRGYDEVVDILIRATSVKDRALYDKIVSSAMDPNGRLNVATLVAAQDWFAANGFIPQKIDVPALIDTQFTDYAVGVLGEYR